MSGMASEYYYDVIAKAQLREPAPNMTFVFEAVEGVQILLLKLMAHHTN